MIVRAAWGFIHNVIAHPLLSITFNSRAANWLHDVTADLAFDQHPEPDLSTRQGKLRALADRIDHERLWRTAGMYRDDWTDDQRARYESGVMLRRYAEILQPGRWLVIPPTGPMQFSAETLERVTEMALRHCAAIAKVRP